MVNTLNFHFAHNPSVAISPASALLGCILGLELQMRYILTILSINTICIGSSVSYKQTFPVIWVFNGYLSLAKLHVDNGGCNVKHLRRNSQCMQ